MPRTCLTAAVAFGLAAAVAAQQRGPSVDDLLPKMPSLSTAPPGQAPRQAPASAHPAAQGLRIPLQPGLVVASVVATADGDQEAEARFTAATRKDLTFDYREFAADASQVSTRTLLRTDLAEAASLRPPLAVDAQPLHAGTTALGLSTRGLRQLKDGGSTALTLRVGNATPAASGEDDDVVAELDALLGEPSGLDGIEAAVNRQADQGTITEGERAQGARDVADIRRLGLATGRLRNTGPLKVAVIVNDRRVLLDAVTATGSLSNGKDDFLVSAVFLDDDANPLALRLSLGDGTSEVTRIGYAQSSLAYASMLEQALQQRCRVDVYGLVFSPGAADLYAGSEETLATLRTVFARHPEWTLAVLSHGDHLVPADLSLRRAQAIRTALAADGAARLVAVPLPRAAPLAGNHTVAGRALNRRTTFSRTGCPR